MYDSHFTYEKRDDLSEMLKQTGARPGARGVAGVRRDTHRRRSSCRAARPCAAPGASPASSAC